MGSRSLTYAERLNQFLDILAYHYSYSENEDKQREYLRRAGEAAQREYANDAAMNGLSLDRHAEEQAVELFASNILKAGEAYLEGGEETPFIPSWQRVAGAHTGVFPDLLQAVAQDRREHAADASSRAVA